MEDYIEIIKKLIESNFLPFHSEESTPIQMGTYRILQMVHGVIPSEPIDEHDIFNVMTELGYKKTLKTLYNQKEGEEKKVSGYVYLWQMYKLE